MTSSSPLLIDLAGIARLADVRRPVASMWRARFSASADPFPSVAQVKSGRLLFDALSVAQWLARTAHGNNPDAVADAAAATCPDSFDFSNPAHVAAVDALLAVHANDTSPLATTPLEIAANNTDPADRFVATELHSARPEWVAWAELLADAAYSPLEASRLLERRHAATRGGEGSAGPLNARASALIVEIASALTTPEHEVLSLQGALAPTLAVALASRLEFCDPSVALNPAGRAIARRLTLEDMPLPALAVDGSARVMTVARFPAPETQTATQVLDALDELTLGMRDNDRALVIAPASVLTAALPTASDLIRADVLRSGRVRAIVQLPAGLVSSASREALALWVLGPPFGDVPIADRLTAVARVTDAALPASVITDVTSDVLAAMGSTTDMHAHSFRFARLVRTTTLLTMRGGLVAAPTTPALAEAEKRDLPALLDQANARLSTSAPQAIPAAVPVRALSTVSIASLLRDRHLRVVRGTRLTEDEYSSAGLRVVRADELAAPTRIGTYRIDPFVFAQRHPSARLTLPGDIVFRTSPTAHAWVDTEGSHVVAHPARVLRINTSDPGGLIADVVARDIARGASGPGAWREWLVRRTTVPMMAPLRQALTTLAAQRAELQAQLDALDEYTDLLATGVISGAVTLTDFAADAASESL